jgi:Ca2+-binding RTX toxin-like protein
MASRRSILPLLAVSLTTALLITAARASEPDTCFSQVPTIVGTEEADTITGTPSADVIVAGGGDDVVRSGAGDDTICLGTGRDRALAGPGNDQLSGGGGADVLAAVVLVGGMIFAPDAVRCAVEGIWEAVAGTSPAQGR